MFNRSFFFTYNKKDMTFVPTEERTFSIHGTCNNVKTALFMRIINHLSNLLY